MALGFHCDFHLIPQISGDELLGNNWQRVDPPYPKMVWKPSHSVPVPPILFSVGLISRESWFTIWSAVLSLIFVFHVFVLVNALICRSSFLIFLFICNKFFSLVLVYNPTCQTLSYHCPGFRWARFCIFAFKLVYNLICSDFRHLLHMLYTLGRNSSWRSFSI